MAGPTLIPSGDFRTSYAEDTTVFPTRAGRNAMIVGIVLMFVWSFWIGLIIALIGLIAFGGFAKGRWY